MKFIYALMATAASIVSASWPDDMLQSRHHIGGQGGAKFWTIGAEGVTVDRIRVYKKDSLVGIKTWFSDGGVSLVGSEDYTSHEYTFDSAKNEVITKMTLWGNGKGTRTGRLYFETSTGGKFDWGQNTDGQSEYPMNVGEGILVGWSGGAGKQIDKLSPIFLKKMLRVYYDDLKYSAFDKRDNLRTVSLDEVSFSSKDVTGGGEFKGKREFSSSASWTKTSGSTLGFGASFSAGVPEVAQVEVSTQWTISQESQTSGSKTWTRGLEWSRTPDLDVLKGTNNIISCTAEASEGTLDLDWTGTLNLVVDAGNGVAGRSWKGPARGRVSSVDVSKVHTDCKLIKKSSKREHVGSPAVRARQILATAN
ncbi:hypothetical protein Micbo1qcDRAFT_207375 [Microdochium bolleyi]|uniref:Jacalin-type lectin domain-containing protein n=1 Tax=Microdochium bolleyi TaxID=196109 RepID=A0A136IT08_9PEZI|nr:hypothetical protein Micbo1qcDRAFT_207375 [Microdochium bolleyi]